MNIFTAAAPAMDFKAMTDREWLKFFKDAAVLYQRAMDEEWDSEMISEQELDGGLCSLAVYISCAQYPETATFLVNRLSIKNLVDDDQFICPPYSVCQNREMAFAPRLKVCFQAVELLK